MNILITLITLSLVISTAACSPSKPDSEAPSDDMSALIDAAEGDVVSGEALTEDYVKLLCKKYTECGVKAFSDPDDCKTRLTAILSQDGNWAQMELDKTALKTCLADFKSLGCEDFTAGKTPEACTKM